ncbi:UNVERIFIED_CONTAM: hypothetical protein RMT77_006407 [Armadillidium vulgare]
MWNNFIIFYFVYTISVSFASDAAYNNEKEKSNSSLIEKRKELGESLRRQMDWFEPSKAIFTKNDKEKDSLTSNEKGRFLNLGGSVTQRDILITILTQAAKDFDDICKEIADKFEDFVNRDEANLMAIEVGTAKLKEILEAFESAAINQANIAVATAMEAAGLGGVGGVVGGGIGGGIVNILSMLGLGKK